jgi:flagellar biosynthesis component FlhA
LLTEVTRKALIRTITEQHTDADGKIMAIVLDPSLEYELRGALTREGEGESLALEPDRAMTLCRRIVDEWKSAMERGLDKTILLCDFRIRPHVAGLIARQLPHLAVLAYDEIAMGTPIESVATVALPAEAAAISQG